MRTLWHRFWLPLTPGVRVILSVLIVMYVAAIIGRFTHAYDLYSPLALSGRDFWSGHVWKIVTYALLPAGLFDFLINWLMILAIGSWLERRWSKTELWMYCLISVVAVGLVRVVVQPSSVWLLVGTTPVVLGLLTAWGRLFTHERVLLGLIWDTSVREAAILLIAASFVIMIPCAGIINALIMMVAVPAVLLTLWLQSKLTWRHRGQTVESERMGRLEL
jgi:membrane associated rhomboid family serine protease